jgi:hypothetical protein
MQIFGLDLEGILPPSRYTAGGLALAFTSAASSGALMMINGGLDPVHAVIGYGIGASLVAAGQYAGPIPAVIGSASITGGCAAVAAATLTNMHANHLPFNETVMESLRMWPIVAANLIPLAAAFDPASEDNGEFFMGASIGALAGLGISASAGYMLATTNPEQAPIWETENVRIIPAPNKEKLGNATIGGYVFSVPSAPSAAA